MSLKTVACKQWHCKFINAFEFLSRYKHSMLKFNYFHKSNIVKYKELLYVHYTIWNRYCQKSMIVELCKYSGNLPRAAHQLLLCYSVLMNESNFNSNIQKETLGRVWDNCISCMSHCMNIISANMSGTRF